MGRVFGYANVALPYSQCERLGGGTGKRKPPPQRSWKPPFV